MTESDVGGRPRSLSTRLFLAVTAALGLSGSAPPAIAPGAEWLVVVGLGAFYAMVIGPRVRGDRWLVLAVGACHMAWFSWSVHHVAWVGFAAIVGLGACYYLLAGACTRGLGCWLPRPVAFALAAAAACQLRAWMPGIYYPHGQFAHALWQWPTALGIVGWAGEVGANLLLAGMAAAVVDAIWGRGRSRSVGRVCLAILLVVGAGAAWLPAPIGDPVDRVADGPAVEAVSVVAMEPGLPVLSILHESTVQRDREVMFRLAGPARRLAPWRGAPADGSPPDLIVWPESSAPLLVRVDGDRDRVLPFYPGGRWQPFPLAARTSLLVSGLVEREERWTPCCALFSPRAKLLGVYEKQRLVPGGEFLPWLGLLPSSVGDAIQEFVETKMGAPANFVPGRHRPLLPLPVRRGEQSVEVPVGALLCYDNAFPAVAREHVAAGARLLVVSSNEAWYRRGNEFEQMAAMSVFRALETATPIVRSTIDGPTLAIGADGRMVDALDWSDPPARTAAELPDSRWLRVSLPLGPGAERPLAWLHALLAQGLLVAVVAAIAARFRFRDRL